jgi:hypothetical protein
MTTEYELRAVIILDALAEQELGTADSPKFLQKLELLLQDVETKTIFTTVLEEKEVRELVGLKNPLTSKQMIDFATLLRSREEPIKMMVPTESLELTKQDLLQTAKLDDKPKPRRKRYRNRKNRNQNHQNKRNNN